eukprot:TRINITY_DN17778_c0_g1_i3.p2 TRINITY_DN17778_c0_g1~~TRINITY_DN17778_c0_g1_i3.p2  ORF type:complete len:152 (-),score=26.08 TRINITY_DN17778_c0_g1_i3:474-929(-)
MHAEQRAGSDPARACTTQSNFFFRVACVELRDGGAQPLRSSSQLKAFHFPSFTYAMLVNTCDKLVFVVLLFWEATSQSSYASPEATSQSSFASPENGRKLSVPATSQSSFASPGNGRTLSDDVPAASQSSFAFPGNGTKLSDDVSDFAVEL